MLGLGLGSLVGGGFSNSRRLAPVKLFAIAELFTGMLGIVSLKLFHRIAEFTAGRSPLETGLVGFLAIVLSTLLMGATLPLLVEYSVRSSQNVGSSVGGLYFANCLGSGLACFLAADWLMRYLGQSGSVRFAAAVNILVATGALGYDLHWRRPQKDGPDRASEVIVIACSSRSPLPYSLALGCAAFSGFAALSYEIIWYRLLAFGSGDTAGAFASLLGAYLFGLALDETGRAILAKSPTGKCGRDVECGDLCFRHGCICRKPAFCLGSQGYVSRQPRKQMARFDHLAVSLRRCKLLWGNVSPSRLCCRQSGRAGRSVTELLVCSEHCWLDIGSTGSGLRFDGLFVHVPDINTSSARRRFLGRGSVWGFRSPTGSIETRICTSCCSDVAHDGGRSAAVWHVVRSLILQE